MEELTIGDVAQRAGIRASAIRYYESVEVLPAPHRVNGRRRYDSSVLSRLAVIQIAQQAGFTVAEIRTLFNGFTPETPASARWEALAQQKLADKLIISVMQHYSPIRIWVWIRAIHTRSLSQTISVHVRCLIMQNFMALAAAVVLRIPVVD